MPRVPYGVLHCQQIRMCDERKPHHKSISAVDAERYTTTLEKRQTRSTSERHKGGAMHRGLKLKTEGLEKAGIFRGVLGNGVHSTLRAGGS